MQGYTLCFNLYEREVNNQGMAKYLSVKKDLVGKVTGKAYKFNKHANHGAGAFCEAVFMT